MPLIPSLAVVTPPAWIWMWAICLGIYASLKWLTWSAAGSRRLGAWTGVAYLGAWPGMDPRPFQRDDRCRPKPPPVDAQSWGWGLAKVVAGLLLIWGGVRCVHPFNPWLAGWIGMIGFVLLMHFGVFDLLASAWRGCGVDVRPIMDSPWRATALSEFWGRRWNSAFRDAAEQLVRRPLTPLCGVQGATAAVFLASGMIHELAITIPAGGDYGGPTLYFGCQLAGLMLQRSRPARVLGLGRGWRGWLLTAVWLVAPLGWLFPESFVVRVFLPFLRVIGAC